MKLSELITSTMKEQNVSYTVLVQRAQEAGYPLFSKAHLSKLVNSTPRAGLQRDTFFALSAALKVSPETVYAAVGESLGIHIYMPDKPGDPVVFSKGSSEGPPVESHIDSIRQQVNRTLDDDSVDPREG